MLEDPWLADRLQQSAFTVEDSDSTKDLALVGPGFYQAKVCAGDMRRVDDLEGAGFRVVDVNITLTRLAAPMVGEPACTVAPARPDEQRSPLLEMAARDYTVSRFHLDPRVPDAVAIAIKRDWLAAYLDEKRGDELLVAEIGGRPVGFLAVMASSDGQRVIDLIAVASDARAAGVGRALVGHLAEYGTRIDVGTQISNVSALRFYESLGFRAQQARYVLHRHV